MPRSEQLILHETLVAATALPGAMFYRQNSGSAWQGERANRAPGAMVVVERGMVILRNARPISFGVPGAADMVGTFDGQAVQAEGKTLTGAQRQAQMNFQRAWEKAGGRYILFRSPEDFLEQLRRGA